MSVGIYWNKPTNSLSSDSSFSEEEASIFFFSAFPSGTTCGSSDADAMQNTIDSVSLAVAVATEATHVHVHMWIKG